MNSSKESLEVGAEASERRRHERARGSAAEREGREETRQLLADEALGFEVGRDDLPAVLLQACGGRS
jgi:hypothetical protein